MRAVVLVGGFGTRLRPLTTTIPKPLLPVVDRSIVEHLVGHLAQHGVTEVVLALGFAPDAFIEAFADGTCAGIAMTYAVEPEPLDTAGAIRFAADAAGIDDTFIVANGDVLSDVDLTALVAYHRSTGAEGTLHLRSVADPSAFGVVGCDDDGRITQFVEKPAPGTEPSNWINAGCYVLEPSVLARIEPGRKVSIERVTFPAIVADGRLYGLLDDCYWLDTGRPEQYREANLDLVDGKRPTLGVRPGVSALADVDATAIVDRSVVRGGAIVGPHACLTESIVLDGARIEPRVILDRSIIGPGSRIGAGAILRNVVVGVDVDIESGSELTDTKVPES
jgi:mannose-1-phosphate guanylyltransferase